MNSEASKAVTSAPADRPLLYNDWFSVTEMRVWEVCGGRNTCFQRIAHTRLKTDLQEHRAEPRGRLKDPSRSGKTVAWTKSRGSVFLCGNGRVS